jgi:NAD(P)H-flavin reductase
MASKNSSGKASRNRTAGRAAPADTPVQGTLSAVAVAQPHMPARREAAVPAAATAGLPAAKPAAQVPAARPEAAAPAVREAASAPATRQEAAPPAASTARPGLKPADDGRMLREISPRPMMRGNPYKPMPATVVEVIEETGNIRTLRVVLDDAAAMRAFSYEPGQVGQLSVFGAGESTFVINSPPSQKDYLQFSVMRAGEVTAAIHRLSPGDKVGVRAPLGNHFPWQDWKGKDIFFVGGGIGMAPIRTVMLHLLERKADYGNISLLYGARSPRDMAYSYELQGWLDNPDLNCTLCIDQPFEGWPHKVGLIPNVLLELAPKAENCVAVLCGPPIMIKFTVQALEKLGFAPENIVTTLEKRMKCGIGICGRCNIGGRYVCVDGPVFTWKQLQELPPEL